MVADQKDALRKANVAVVVVDVISKTWSTEFFILFILQCPFPHCSVWKQLMFRLESQLGIIFLTRKPAPRHTSKVS